MLSTGEVYKQSQQGGRTHILGSCFYSFMGMIPSLVLEGSPRDRGIRHGERFNEEIQENVQQYLKYFSQYGVEEETARDQACRFISLIEDANETYFEEMEGIAEGSDLPLEDVTIVNVRHTIVYSAYASETASEQTEAVDSADGCTSFGIQPERSTNQRTLIGQNWDWLEPINAFIMDARPDEAPNMISLTEAGMVGGKFGLNEHGIGYVVNGLTTPTDGENLSRKPSHVRGREILTADRLDGAIEPIISEKRPCSRNYLVAHESGEMVDIETGPETVSYIYPQDGVLTHANHFQDRTTFSSEFERMIPHTICRGMRIDRLFSQLQTVGEADLKTVLRDHFDEPTSICHHEDQEEDSLSHTKASVIMDLQNRRMLAAAGPPCENEYIEFTVAT